MTEDEFVSRVLAGQPEPPRYFAEMKRLNKQGPRILGGLRRPAHLPPEMIVEITGGDALVVDTRPADAFAGGHIPGTLNIPLTRSFTTWAGSLVPYDRKLYLLVEDTARMDAAMLDLAMIGLDSVSGYFLSPALEAWSATGRVLATTQQMTPQELAGALQAGRVNVIDVRGASEWESGHVPAVPNIPLGSLEEHLEDLPRGRPVVVYCQTGGRSAIATSLLKAHGIEDIVNLTGGFAAWARAGNPTEAGSPAVSGA
jgi:hydroxyacylglutathione hydrolase